MKQKILFTAMLLLTAATLMAQGKVGVNTINPQAVLHVDGAKDNPATGTPTETQALNDLVVTQFGRMGIGTTAPRAGLDIIGKGGIILSPDNPTSASSGRITMANSDEPANFDREFIITGTSATATEAQRTSVFIGPSAAGALREMGRVQIAGANVDVFGNLGVGVAMPAEKLEVNGKIKAANVIFTGIPTYTNDAAAGTGGLVQGDMYKTAAGVLMIKL